MQEKERKRFQVKIKLKAPEISKKTLPNYIAALLLLVLAVMMFMPYWHYTATESVRETQVVDGRTKTVSKRVEVEKDTSMNAYVWFPNDYKPLQNALKAAIESKAAIKVTHTVLQPVIMLIFSVVGAGFCLVMPSRKIAAFFPALVGAVGIWCFASISIYRVLNTLWIPMLVICCLALVAGIVGMIFNPKKPVKKLVAA